MLDHSQFVVHYKDRDDIDFIRSMGTKLEFRELLLRYNPNAPNNDDPFFYNYQMLIGRWMAPWTNNRALLVRWDPGSGKTRAAFIFSLMWMRYSKHKKVLMISNSDIVLRAMGDEVVKYNNFDTILERGVYRQGRRAHGKTLRKNRYVKKQGFETYTIGKFMNRMYELFGDKNGYDEKGSARKAIMADPEVRELFMQFLRSLFGSYTVTVDEVHYFRKTKKEKKTYNDVIILLDALRPVCPLLLMTATPVVNTWEDIFSIIGMLHPSEVRAEIEESMSGIPTYTTNEDDINHIDSMVIKYSQGLVSDRRSEGIVPLKYSLPNPYNYSEIVDPNMERITFAIEEIPDDDGIGGSSQDITENIYPVFMSTYQTEYTSITENSDTIKKTLDTESEQLISKLVAKDSLYLNLRAAYDFAPPIVSGRYMQTKDLIYQDTSDKRHKASNNATIKLQGLPDENIFLMSWLAPTDSQLSEWNNMITRYNQRNGTNLSLFNSTNVRFPNLNTGLAKYTIKYASLLWMLEYHPLLQGIPGYVHTLWVKIGTKLMAAAFNENGWDQYTGNEPIDKPSIDEITGRMRYRFAIIDQDTKPTHITRMIEVFNSPKNRDGSLLRIIIGSRKSGISISLSNGQFFIELSPDFNKSTRIQSEGRVFRADSLDWMRQLGMTRRVFTADIVSLPDVYYENIPDEADREELAMIRDDYMTDIKGGFFKNQIYASITTSNGITYNINPVTIEVRMYKLAEDKYRMTRVVMDAMHRSSIENIIHMNKDAPDDILNYSLLYSGKERAQIKDDIISRIPQQWVYKLNTDSMDVMRVAAEMVSSKTVIPTRYGMPRPIQSYSDVVTTSMDTSYGSLSLIYDRNFFVVSEKRGYPINAINNTIEFLSNSPLDRYEFFRYISDSSVSDYKGIALEMALVLPRYILTDEQIERFNQRRSLILDLYDGMWNTFGGGRIVHILLYGTKHLSHLSKDRINTTPIKLTRIITHEDNSSTDDTWSYIVPKEREAIYLTMMAKALADREIIVRTNAKEYGYYVHFSLYDGNLLLREIDSDDRRTAKTYDVNLTVALPIVATIMNTSPDSLKLQYGNDVIAFRKVFFYRAESLRILMIR